VTWLSRCGAGSPASDAEALKVAAALIVSIGRTSAGTSVGNRSRGEVERVMALTYYYRKQVIEIFEVDESFLDILEAEDLVHPVQEESTREKVFPPDQVERIRIINNLVNDLEVNLAGVEVIMEMRENLIRMQRQFDQILESLVRELKTRLPD
jgi:MerR family transcriptional regulator/heat shock protein HspR